MEERCFWSEEASGSRQGSSGREGKMVPNHCVESNMFLNLSLEGIFYIIEMASV